MDRRTWIIVAVALVAVVAAAFGYSLTRGGSDEAAEASDIADAREQKLQDACASKATYARLKEVAFEEAIRIRNADPANLDTLATHSVVRMENPVVKSRDDALGVIVCSGTFVLELPPGAERGFGGQRRLTARIEYASHRAVDGSGLVYSMSGAEPIVYKLAAFDLQGQRYAPPAGEEQMAQAQPQPQPTPAAAPEPQPAPVASAAPPTTQPQPRPNAQPQPQPAAPARAAANPSFNCRYARSQSERMVCGSERLAALDRSMSSLFYSALADADPTARRELRRTRDRFLAYRDRCGSEACIADAYRGRMQEIRDIAR